MEPSIPFIRTVTPSRTTTPNTARAPAFFRPIPSTTAPITLKTKTTLHDLSLRRPVLSDRGSRSRFCPSLTDACDPILPPLPRRRHTGQVTSMTNNSLYVDDKNPYSPFLFVFTSGRKTRSWDAYETNEAMYLSVEMPGLGREDVKVSLGENHLRIRGESSTGGGWKYDSRFDLPERVDKYGDFKVEMKNGVLKLVIPKKQEVAEVRDLEVE